MDLTVSRARLPQNTFNHLRIGLLYIYVVDSKVLEGSQYKTALDFICSNCREVSRTALLLYASVARAFSEPVAERFGMTRLQLLLTYKKAAKVELNFDEPDGTLIRVPAADGVVEAKRFADCSVDELRQAVAHLRESTPSQPIPQEDRTRYDGYLQAVTSRFSQGSPVRVLMRTLEGKTVLDFKSVPIDEVEELVEALREQLYAMREAAQTEQAAAQMS